MQNHLQDNNMYTNEKYNCLDLETDPLYEEMRGYAALEPWRLRNLEARIMSADLIRGNDDVEQIVNDGRSYDEVFPDKLKTMLESLDGQVVWAHNAIFDVAWCIAQLQPDRAGPIPDCVRKIKWRDTGLLMKWIINGQKAEKAKVSMSLANLVKMFMPEHPQAQEFIDFKAKGFDMVGQNKAYWLERGKLDVIMTKALACKFTPKVPESMRLGMMTEFNCIVPLANAWLNGIRIDQDQLKVCEDYYGNRKADIAKLLDVKPTLFSSPKQLAKYLFTDLGLMPVSQTPTGNPGTSKGDIMWIQRRLLAREGVNGEAYKVVTKILEAKESTTLFSKYVKTCKEALAHNGDGYIYGSPRLFGTYTGRMTYSNATMKKFKTGIALHQIPRKASMVRAMLVPHKGYKIYEADASVQESRLMAIRSGDPVMIKVFANDMNFHAMTGASINTIDYNEFMEHYKAEEADGGEGEYTEMRQMGKLGNLSCNYRISGKALSIQSFEKYGVFMEVSTGQLVTKTFSDTYKGVPQYWKDVITDSRLSGYTEAFGGRRFKLSEWSGEKWLTESSAISFPIQGSGASMKEIAISEIYEKVPEFQFALDLHDATFGYIPEENADEVRAKIDHVLDNIDYSKYWGFTPKISLPYESKMGESFKDVK